MIRFWWASDTDMTMTRARLEKLKTGQLSEWSWSRWVDPMLPAAELEARGMEPPHMELIRSITMASIFDEGRVVYTFGVPSFQDKLAAELKNIPDKVLFILIAKPEKILTLFKRAKDLEKDGKAKIDEYSALSPSETIQFIKDRAEYYSSQIDHISCKMLIDFVGFNQNRLDSEVQKLAIFSGGNITPNIVQDGCYSDGQANATELPDLITLNKSNVHEMMRRARLDVDGEDRFLTLFLEWAAKLCLAESCGRNIDALNKEDIAKFKKLASVTIKLADGKTKKHPPISMAEFNRGKVLGSPGKLIANPNSIYYACNSLKESGRESGWGFLVLGQLFELYVGLRTNSDSAVADRLWQQFIVWVNEMPKRREF